MPAAPLQAGTRSHDLALQQALNAFNRDRMCPRLPPDLDDRDRAPRRIQAPAMLALEADFVADERHRIAARAAAAPSDPDAFVRWFEALREDGPGQGDPLFPWLAEHATLEQLRWFLTQEVAGEAGFEDLIALTQLRLPEAAKLEMARNFWDEMGRGKTAGMHGPMLARLGAALVLVGEPVVAESLALGNLMLAMATNRELAFHSVGALGIIEETAPGRATCVNAGLRRVGVGPHERQYFALHATLDVQHSIAWNREVIASLVRERPATARAIAEGALMRLTAGARCFERYRAELGVRSDRALQQ